MRAMGGFVLRLLELTLLLAVIVAIALLLTHFDTAIVEELGRDVERVDSAVREVVERVSEAVEEVIKVIEQL